MSFNFRSAVRRFLRVRSPFLAEQPELARFEIGKWSYGRLKVVQWDQHSRLSIGRYCSIADGTTVLLGGEHHLDWVSTYPFGEMFPCSVPVPSQAWSKGGVAIGNDVWVGRESLIMSGVAIGDGAVIGARSLVNRHIPPFAVAAGQPARVIRYRYDETTIQRLLALAWWNWEDSEVQAAIPHLMSRDISSFLEKYTRSREGTVGPTRGRS